MPTAAVELLVDIAQTVSSEPDVLQFFREFHQKNVLRGEWHTEYSPIPIDARIQARYANQTSLFYLLAYLSALPIAEREYARRGIDPRILSPAAPAPPNNLFQDRVEVVGFSTRGTYLVICAVNVHFNDGMFGWVKVIA